MIKISLLTIESDNADPEILAAIRELLERAGVSGAVVMQAVGVEPAAAPASAAPPPAPPTRAQTCPAFPPCKPCRENAGECGWSSATKSEAKPEPAPAVEPEPVAAVEPPPPATAAAPEPQTVTPPDVLSSTRALELVAERPGISALDLTFALTGSTSQGARVRVGRLMTPLVLSGHVRRSGDSGSYRYSPPETLPSYPVVTRPLRVHVPEGALPPAHDPTGRVEGYTAPPAHVNALHERIVAAAKANPGISIANLAVGLLGGGSQEQRRRIDFAAGPLVMAGELMRLNGGLYPKGYRGPTAPVASQRPIATPTPAVSNEQYYRRIVAAFERDNATSIPNLAADLFGESTGKSVAKLQLMLRQLVASERLEHLGGGEYRPVADDEQRDDSDEDVDPDSNGHADDGDLQELDLN